MITKLRFSYIITNLVGNSDCKQRPVHNLKNNTESGP